jgi:hypothetical protein
VGELIVYSFVIIVFVVGFFIGLIVAFNLKKRLERGEIDWQKCRKVRTRGIVVFVGFGVILALIGYYCIATDLRLISLLLVGEIHILTEGFLLLGIVILGVMSLGVGLGALIYPIKKPSTD